MKSVHSQLLVATLICLALPLAARSDDGGWKMPNLNPFSRPAGPPTSARVNNGSGLKMPQVPKLWPGGVNTAKTAAKPKGPSTWQKMASGTKSVVAKTADAINPFDDANDKVAKPLSATGSKSAFHQASAKKKPAPASTASAWPTWLGGSGAQETPRPKSVNDFLNQPRLQP